MEPEAQLPPAPASRLERRAKAAADALRTLIRDAHVEQFGPLVQGRETLALQLRLSVRPADNWTLAFDPPLADQVAAQLQDAQADRGAARRGRAYCFRCGTSDCSHALPPSSLHVFAGYSPTGQPEWDEFAQTLIAARDDRVDRLFAARPGILARVGFGRDLRHRQLQTFGRASKTYALLGQVTAGYFPAPAAAGPEPARRTERLAVTFQAVETRSPGGAFRLILNTIGAPPDGGLLDDALAADAGWARLVARAREIAARGLEDLERRVLLAREAGRPETGLAAMKAVPTILARLAESLERGDRQQVRRTRHAEARRGDDRPIHKALEDALAAAPEAHFVDTRTDGRVVCGPQGRAHIFNAEGRHITSFSLTPEAVAHRLRTERWKPLEADRRTAFRARLLALAEGDATAS